MLETVRNDQADKGFGFDLLKAIKELQGLTVSVIGVGAAAGTKMNVAALRDEDTIVSVLTQPSGAAGAWADDSANVTIQDTHAAGTITLNADPADGNTVVVGAYTYTFKAAPTALTHAKITAGDTTATAAALAAAINAQENRRVTGSNAAGGQWNSPAVSASAAANVVTVTAVDDGPGNGVAVSSSTGVRLAVTGANSASATVTAAAAANADTVTLVDSNGANVVFTIKTVPDVSVMTDVAVGGTNDEQATLLANAINAYEARHGTLDVSASAAAAVVTLVPRTYLKGNVIPLSKVGANVAVSGAALSGGTSTGGIKSTTDLSAKTVTVIWFNKQ